MGCWCRIIWKPYHIRSVAGTKERIQVTRQPNLHPCVKPSDRNMRVCRICRELVYVRYSFFLDLGKGIINMNVHRTQGDLA